MGSMLAPTMGGAIDHYGTRRRIKHNHVFEIDARVDAATLALMADAVRDMKTLVGRTGWLVRTEQDGTNSLRRYCRLLGVGFTPKWSQRGVINVLSMRFETNQPFWYSATLTTHAATSISSGVDFDLTIAGEEDVLDPIITIAATGTIGFVIVEHNFTDAGETVTNRLIYNATLVNTDSLVIDCGQYTVKKNGTAAYEDFYPSVQHTGNYWMRLPPGTQTFNVTLSTGSGTRKFEYYPAYQ